ncbi:MAG: hypothetical protein OER80_09350 [Gammaproteobacteria bacterium]|nr:hypothetical protein [Gammaproteobacteria bacterium]MDH3768351.1 hypothetical protein [Gammaproteobacteria bacterium]
MDLFEMVVAIVAISCFAGVVNNWLKTRKKVDRSELDRQMGTRLDELHKLEKRMQVLERIVTDRQYDLKRELHELESE